MKINFSAISLAFLLILIGGALAVPVYASAQETVAMVEGTAISHALTDEERQARLAEILTELEEVERELLLLSLAVQKLVLEEQALALEQQLQQELAQQQESPVAMPDSSPEVPETVVAQDEGGESGGVLVKELDRAAVSFDEQTNGQEDEEGEERREGFLAGIGPLSNLGTPELAVLAILVFLVALMVVRRLRERREAQRQTIPASSAGRVLQFSSPGGDATHPDAIAEGRQQELKEKIA